MHGPRAPRPTRLGLTGMLMLLGCLAVQITATRASAQLTTIKEVARFKDDSRYVLQGIGIVTGLGGTGDDGSELMVAQPLIAMLEAQGNPLPSLEDVANTKSVALVSVTVSVPRGGAHKNDALDASISTYGSASSIAGGKLEICVLRGPFPGDPVFAIAYGDIVSQDPAMPTRGVVREGAQIVRDIITEPSSMATFDLVVEPWYRGHAAVSQIAASINGQFASLASLSQPVSPNSTQPTDNGRFQRFAVGIGDRTVRVFIPEADRLDPSAFMAEVMDAPIDPSQLGVPARVIVNSRTGAIAVAGEVRISPVAITVNGLTISTTTPEPIPTELDPLVQTNRWAPISTDANDRESARLQDLQASFRRLDVPVAQQIEVLQMLKKMGKLHAELIID